MWYLCSIQSHPPQAIRFASPTSHSQPAVRVYFHGFHYWLASSPWIWCNARHGRSIYKNGSFSSCAKTISVEETTNIFLKNVVRLHAFSDDVTCDRRPQFVSHFCWRLFQTLGTIVNLSSSYHPQIDGQIERVNQILEQYLRYSLRYQQDDWIDLLPLVELTFNNTIHGSTGVTPFFSNYGFNISIPGNSVNPSTEERARTLANIHQDVSLQLILLGNRYKAQAYQHRSAAPSFVVGDQLWLLHRHIDTTRPCGKLDYKKSGPFRIIEHINHVIQHTRSST